MDSSDEDEVYKDAIDEPEEPDNNKRDNSHKKEASCIYTNHNYM